jgi:AraC family transcriptional regulator, transcriptional activator of pobA
MNFELLLLGNKDTEGEETIQLVNKKRRRYQPQGLALVFHADLVHGTSLGRHINDYTFFSYTTNEALHLSERERQIILECFSKIKFELEHSVDKHK